jgi:hypothetical protein
MAHIKVTNYDDDDNNNNNNNNNTVYVEFINKSDTRNNRGNWNHLKITQKLSKNIPEKHVKELQPYWALHT